MDFSEFLREYDDGRLHQQLGEAMSKVVDGAQCHGSIGSLTLKFDVKKEGDRCVITPKVTAKIPTESAATTMWFFNLKGGVSRDNPKQMTLRDLEPQTEKDTTDE